VERLHATRQSWRTYGNREMKKICLVLVLCILPSCDLAWEEEEANIPPEEVWVCHNPESEYHGHLCNDQCYWVGLQKVESSFCWLIEKSECEPPLEFAWQTENCHFFQ